MNENAKTTRDDILFYYILLLNAYSSSRIVGAGNCFFQPKKSGNKPYNKSTEQAKCLKIKLRKIHLQRDSYH